MIFGVSGSINKIPTHKICVGKNNFLKFFKKLEIKVYDLENLF